MPATGTAGAVDATLARFTEINPADNEARRAVVAQWKQLIADDPDALRVLYDRYFATVARLLGHDAADGLDGVAGYSFVGTFSTRRYLGRADRLAWQLLMAADSDHMALLAEAMERPDELITPDHLRTETGRWGDIPQAMLELYYWIAPYDDERDEPLARVTALVPTFFTTFPEQDSHVLVGLLGDHPDLVEVTAGLIRHHLRQLQPPRTELLRTLGSEMLGMHAESRKPLTKHAAAILTLVLSDAENWPADVVDLFLSLFVERPLSVGERGAANGESSEEAQRERRAALQRINVSTATRKGLTAIGKNLPASHRARVTDLLDEAAAQKARPKRFPIASPKQNRFADLGLKLLVIEELMYRQQVLEPRFTVHEFAKEYDKREISVESEGHRVIPEVQRYYKHLPIDDDLLAKVERLHQSSGLDGGAEFMRQLFPFWDPGMGDEPIKVTNKAIADLALLPNLKVITGLENSKPSKKLTAALTEHGVTLLPEDTEETEDAEGAAGA